MERVISHSSGMNNESTLSNATNFFFDALLIVVIIGITAGSWEDWIWFADNFERL